MNKYVSVTTTNVIEGTVIENYFEVIASHVVFGTHLFSDFAASFTDLFGGQSGTYQRKLERLYQAAISQLKDQAFQIGANAIIGLKIDFDEISGKGKSMFMVSAIGTAVKVKAIDPKIGMNEIKAPSLVSSQDVEVRLTQRRLIELLKSNRLPSRDDWNFLFENPSDEFNEYLLNLYVTDQELTIEGQQSLDTNIRTYFGRIEPDSAMRCIYNRIRTNKKFIELLEANNLFSPSEVLSLFKDGYSDLTIACLSLNKGAYNKDSDIPLMEQISRCIDEIPDIGEKKVIKGGLMSKEKEKFICPDGHQNDSNESFCLKCGKNTKGLTRMQLGVIDEFNNKISVIKELLE